MANISSYLAAIMAAVYGEDVRGSIHDAIEIINDVSEVVLNTGTAVTGPTSSSTGFYKDSFYINTSTMELWKCIGTNSWQSQGVLKGADGADGNGIVSITKTATVGLVDTYTITYDDGTTSTYDVTNGQNGSKWYKGTAISGTGTSITGFPGVINDFYLNSSTGYVYTCTKTGGSLLPDAAEWDYVMALTGGGGTSVTVIDNLTSSSSTDALSANQGRVLKGLVDGNTTDISTINGLIPSTATTSNKLATAADIPTVNDAILTIQQNGTSKGTFTANSSTATTANIVTDDWFRVGGTIVEAILSTTDVSTTFNGLNSNYAYKPFIQVADGEDALPYKTMVFSGTSVTITYDSPSAAQAAGNACILRLREIK